MRYKSVIFDFDGTLCNTGEGVMKSAKYALEAFGRKNTEQTLQRQLSLLINTGKDTTKRGFMKASFMTALKSF